MKEINGKLVSIKMPDNLIDEVERIAKKRKMTMAEVYRMMIELGTEIHRDMEKVGVVAAVDFIYYCKQALKAQNDKVAQGNQLRLPLT